MVLLAVVAASLLLASRSRCCEDQVSVDIPLLIGTMMKSIGCRNVVNQRCPDLA